jgi:glycosyltransferase involved in cell wall biosynthesis
LRIAFAYHRIAPECLGGAERYYTTLCRTLARDEQVTYLSGYVWDGPRRIVRDGVEIIGLAAPRARGRFLPKLRFAAALAVRLLRCGRSYDVVHVCCFPSAAVAAAWIGLLPHRRTHLVVDWHEVLPRVTWHERMGPVVGSLGWLAQAVALRLGDAAVTFSWLHARRLREAGCRCPIHLIPEFHPEPQQRPAEPAAGREPLVIFAGRLVAEKRAHLLAPVVAALRRHDPAWRGIIFGIGPEETMVRDELELHGVTDAVVLAGFARWEELAAAFARGRALVLPTTREGFGLAVLEAAAQGLPSVLVRERDNAAVELIVEGRNGRVADHADGDAIAAAVLALAADPHIHDSTCAWYEEASRRFNVDVTVADLHSLYADLRRSVRLAR